MKLQHLRKARTLYPSGGIWYARSYPHANGYLGMKSKKRKSLGEHVVMAGGRDILASIRLHSRQVLAGTAAALSFAVVATAYLLY